MWKTLEKPGSLQPTTAAGWLAALHGIAGIVAASLSADAPAPSSAVFIALVFCQTSLIGMWGGFGHAHGTLRVVGVVLGIILLWALLGLGIRALDSLTFLLVFIATSVVALVTWGVRRLKARLVRIGAASGVASEGLQFTIRHLLLLTFVVACLLSVGKLFAPYLMTVDVAMRVVVLALCFVAVALSAMWAMLGFGSPLWRLAPVLLVSGGAGGVAAYVFAHGSDAFWISLPLLEAALLLISLGVLRGSGYRLAAHR